MSSIHGTSEHRGTRIVSLLPRSHRFVRWPVGSRTRVHHHQRQIGFELPRAGLDAPRPRKTKELRPLAGCPRLTPTARERPFQLCSRPKTELERLATLRSLAARRITITGAAMTRPISSSHVLSSKRQPFMPRRAPKNDRVWPVSPICCNRPSGASKSTMSKRWRPVRRPAPRHGRSRAHQTRRRHARPHCKLQSGRRVKKSEPARTSDRRAQDRDTSRAGCRCVARFGRHPATETQATTGVSRGGAHEHRRPEVDDTGRACVHL